MTPLDEWRAAAGLSNDAERNRALASWAVKHGRELAEQAGGSGDLGARVGRYWTGLRWVPWEHRRFLAAGWKQLAKKALAHNRAAKRLAAEHRSELDVAHEIGWDKARDLYGGHTETIRTYLRRALAECDPKTRQAIEDDAREDGVL